MSENAPVLHDKEKFDAAIRRFDEENARDPHQEAFGDAKHPRELLYSQRLSEWVLRMAPGASEALRLASRCQHLCRWSIPRESYPMTRVGYLKWRSDLKDFHARRAGEILREVGYPDELVNRVQALNLKQNLSTDQETQTLEDALCLVFLQYQFAELLGRTEAEKMKGILQKTWEKMSAAAHARALEIQYSPEEKKALESALSPA